VVREVGYPDPNTFLPTFAEAASWLDETLERAGIAPDRTVVGGFSQGAVMSYALSLAAGRPSPAAILAFSGFIPRVDGFELDLETGAGLPVSIAHGTFDPIIGVEWGRDARERLEAAGAAVAYREDPVAHQISPGGLTQARAVIERALN
jgi:phospholipase/carboxylesterase